ncbi:DUF2971 domain-containing protein [Thalassobellus suaedae]|uniref:DUF2971 domain-containing protein n=1 Tax=Thalassobellus suaedae TaxID=3074124 RepID=A0ABY9XP24_9FLAO|nr:DUF2971 domain-containing protein [Flavobacteriaceae bacterium HL-DH14]
MFVYKYRGGNDDCFERDLKSLENNSFWGANYDDLNDPFEAVINPEKIINQVNWFYRLFGIKSKEELRLVSQNTEEVVSFDRKMGIYSLSKTFLDEILWAHYSNSHNGFCIGYDLNILLEEKKYIITSFPVIYSKTPPKISFNHLFGGASFRTKRAVGYKSIRWKYEEEYRIITASSGLNYYNPLAVKSIYFGLRMKESHKNKIIDKLKNRSIKYFQIERLPNSYNLVARSLNNN